MDHIMRQDKNTEWINITPSHPQDRHFRRIALPTDSGWPPGSYHELSVRGSLGKRITLCSLLFSYLMGIELISEWSP